MKTAIAIASALVAIGAYVAAGAILQPPRPTDPGVLSLDLSFTEHIGATTNLSISSKGFFLRDRDTFFWKLFTDKFGANPNTPYMWSALPLLGFLLPSPM